MNDPSVEKSTEQGLEGILETGFVADVWAEIFSWTSVALLVTN
jgi:hypothetical protein